MQRFEALAKLFQIGTGVSARDLRYLFREIERGVGIILGMNSQLYPDSVKGGTHVIFGARAHNISVFKPARGSEFISAGGLIDCKGQHTVNGSGN